MQTVTVKIKTFAGKLEEHEGYILGQFVMMDALVKAPTGTKTYGAAAIVCPVDESDADTAYRAPRTATVRNRNWPVIRLGAEAAATATENY